MKEIAGIIIIVLAIAAGLYVGVWLMFILGIVQIVEACKADPVSAMGIAIGIVRVCGATIVGFLCGAVGIGIGCAVFTGGK